MSARGANARSQAQSSRRVHHVVEHLQAVVAHADRVGVGKGQAELAPHRAVVLDHGASSPPTYCPGVWTRAAAAR